MRILLSKSSKEKLFKFLKEKNNVNNLNQLSKKILISPNTLQKWFYFDKRYVPEKFIPDEIKNNLEILDKRENNWGSIKGGKRTYQVILEKYGIKEIKRRQIKGGQVAKKIQMMNEKEFEIDINNILFLEFYGVLLGDGWLSQLKYKNKNIWLVGVSGDKRLDKEFFLYLNKNIKNLFNRNAYIKERKDSNGMELNFCHKMLIKSLNKNLDFPIGEKLDLKINDKVYNLGYEKMKNVIRGIFDTDGSFFFDKTPVGKPYPCINITMKAPRLIKQVYDLLIREGFKVQYDKHRSPIEQLKLKGMKQLNKWMQEIGSSNQRHLRKIMPLWRNSDSAAAS